MWNIFKLKIIKSAILDSKKITESKPKVFQPKVIESIMQYFNKKVTESTILDSNTHKKIIKKIIESTILDSIKTPISIIFRIKN